MQLNGDVQYYLVLKCAGTWVRGDVCLNAQPHDGARSAYWCLLVHEAGPLSFLELYFIRFNSRLFD